MSGCNHHCILALRSRRARAALCGIAGLLACAGPARAVDVDLSGAILDRIREGVGEDGLYRALFKEARTAGADLRSFRFTGDVELLALEVLPPGAPIPTSVEIGQARAAQNCKTEGAVTRTFELNKTETATATFTNETTMSHTAGIQLATKVKVPYVGGVDTTLSYQFQYSGTSATGQETSTEYGWSEAFTEEIQPLERAVIQILVHKNSGTLPYRATLRATGPAEVEFAGALKTVATAGPICLRTYSERHYLSVDQAEGNRYVHAKWTGCKEWESFRLEDGNGGSLVYGDPVSIRAEHWGTYLSAQPNGALEGNRTWKDAWERFQITKLAGSGAIRIGDTVLFRGAHGKYMIAAGGGGSRAYALHDNRGTHERFTIMRSEFKAANRNAWRYPGKKGIVQIADLLGTEQRTFTLHGRFDGDIAAQSEAVIWNEPAECSPYEIAAAVAGTAARGPATQTAAVAAPDATGIVDLPEAQVARLEPPPHARRVPAALFQLDATLADEPIPRPGYDYEIAPDDSLWKIARDALGREATAAEVHAYVGRIAAANEGRLGANPDLLRAGGTLKLPAADPLGQPRASKP